MIIEGTVVGDFQQTNLTGFFVQEEDTDADGDPQTSDGIFVYGDAVDVAVGDWVRVQGDVNEYCELTELNNVGTDVLICGSTTTANAASLTLPLASDTYLERYEGMQVHLPQELSITENYDLGWYGEVIVSSGGRLMNPTNVITPGVEAVRMQAANDLNRLIIDDGSTIQNPDPIVYPSPELSVAHTLRGGDVVSGVLGVLTYSWSGYEGTDSYRVHPIKTPTFTAANRRPAAPYPISGTLRVATLTVLNDFKRGCTGWWLPHRTWRKHTFGARASTHEDHHCCLGYGC